MGVLLHQKQHLKTSVPRADSFHSDPNLVFGFRAEVSDYTRSGFDKGHMAPNKDMSRDSNTQVESFYLSNIVPQSPANNQKFWRALEDRFRQYVNTYGSLYIITGPIFNKPLPAGSQSLVATVGKDQVGVPTWLFKIAVRKLPNGHYDALAFEVPNLPITDTSANYKAAMANALTSIDAIEMDTGLDFLNALSVAEQKRIESKPAKCLWLMDTDKCSTRSSTTKVPTKANPVLR